MAVIVIPNEKPIRACKCNATIIADMAATTSGSGALLGGKPMQIKEITMEDDAREDRMKRLLGND